MTKYTPMPEDNIFILLLMLIFSCGLYYLWWLVRVSKLFNDSPVTNVLLVITTFGIWGIYLNLRYLQKSEELNNRQLQWYSVFFLLVSVLIIQNNINEYVHTGARL